MAHKIGIYYDKQGLRNIMKGSSIARIESNIMMRKLSEVRASFFQEFGFQGEFEIKAVTTNSRRSRITYRIVAANSATAAALKHKPGWLAKFIK